MKFDDLVWQLSEADPSKPKTARFGKPACAAPLASAIATAALPAAVI